MSTFLTPPVWYDETGNKIDILNNKTYNGSPSNTAIGTSAIAGKPSSEGACFGAVAVGSQAEAKAPNSIAVGSYDVDITSPVRALGSGSIAIGGGTITSAAAVDGIAIGRAAAASVEGGIAIGGGAEASEQGGIAIGQDAYVTNSNVIQLGSNTTRYTLNVGNGNGTINGYIESGIAVPSVHQGFEDVTYITDGASTNTKQSIKGGIYIVRVDSASYVADYRTLCTFLFEIYTASEPIYSSPFRYNSGSGGDFAVVKATPVPNDAGMFTLSVVSDALSVAQELKYFTISVRLISESYPLG